MTDKFQKQIKSIFKDILRFLVILAGISLLFAGACLITVIGISQL